MYFLSLHFKLWYRYTGFLSLWFNSGVTLDDTLFICLCAGADSDWHHLEFVTCWEAHAQRVERAWVWGVKSHHDRTASQLINLLVVQMNNEYLRVQTANTCVYSNMLPCSNKLNVILLTTVSSYKLCNFSAYCTI